MEGSPSYGQMPVMSGVGSSRRGRGIVSRSFVLGLLVAVSVPTGTRAADLTGSVSFSPDPGQRGSNMVLSITFTNPNGATQTEVGFSTAYSYATGMRNSNETLLTNPCGGTASLSQDEGSLDYFLATLAPNSSCTITNNVWANSTGDFEFVVYIRSKENNNPVRLSSTSHNRLIAPTMNSSFSSPTIAVNGTSILTVSITNRDLDDATNVPEPIYGLGFSETYPLAVKNAANPNVSHDCAEGTVAAAPGGSQLVASGLKVPPSRGSCHVFVTLTADAEGQHSVPTTTSLPVSSSNAATAYLIRKNLEVYWSPPSVGKWFESPTVAVNTPNLMTITLFNPAWNPTALTGVGFTDTYPAGMVNFPGTAKSNSCGGMLTAVDGGGSIALSDGTIPLNGSCSITIYVTSSLMGQVANDTGVVSSLSLIHI